MIIGSSRLAFQLNKELNARIDGAILSSQRLTLEKGRDGDPGVPISILEGMAYFMLERPETGTVALELFSPGLRSKGLLDVPGSKRISDLLNDPSETLALRDVRFGSIEGTLLETVAEFSVEKRSILVAVPWESTGYLAARRVARFGVSRPKLAETPVIVAIPPFVVRGLLHVPPSVGPARLLSTLGHFFALTDGVVELNRLALGEASTVILNREVVLGLGRLDERSNVPQKGQQVQGVPGVSSQAR